MSYMIEGCGDVKMSRSKAWLYCHPEASHQLLQAITDVCVDYLEGQVRGYRIAPHFQSSRKGKGKGKGKD